jgi:aspartyl-tRNA(Asn)/glutamyl-tRNA(Gln) amidotransferase subunit C
MFSSCLLFKTKVFHFSLGPLDFKFVHMADFNIKYIAHLARIALTPEEEKKLTAQLGNVLVYIEKLKELDVSNVEPTAHAVLLLNVTRVDEIGESLSQEEALRNAPAQANGLFIVPKIVE